MINFTNDSEWDTIANSVLSAIPGKRDYNEWLNVVSLAKEAGYCREDVINFSPGNSEGLDEAKWAGLPKKNDKKAARTILYSIAQKNGFTLPETAQKRQNINWISHVQDESKDRLNDYANARKLIQILYGNDKTFTICKGKISQKVGKYIPDSSSIRQYTYNQITDELLNQLYYGMAGAYIMLNPVDPGKLQEAVKSCKGVKADMITDYPYYFIESDPDGDCNYDEYIENQKVLLSRLDIPWIAMVHSGNKSIHTIIRLDAKSEDEFKVNLEKIHTYLKKQNYTFDESNKNPNKWSRFFTAGRKSNKQHVIAINNNPISFANWYNSHPELQPKKSCNGLFVDGKVAYSGFYSLLNLLGIYCVNNNGKNEPVKITGKFIKKITMDQLSRMCEKYVKCSAEKLSLTEVENWQKFQEKMSETMLRNVEEITQSIHTDSEDTVYLYFRNGFLAIKKDSCELRDYNEIEGYIWEDTYKSVNHDYTPADNTKSMYRDFIETIAGSPENFNKFKSAIGFAISRHKTRIKNRALFLVDKKAEIDSETSTGGTGKGLIISALEQVRKLGQNNGREYHSGDRFSLSSYEEDQSLYVFNDTSNSFRIDTIYNHITDKFFVEKKGQDKMVIDFADSPKIIITSNSYPRDMDSVSTLRRLCILEFENVFNANY